MDSEILNDIKLWRKKNVGKNFGFRDYVFHKLKDVNSEIYFALLELYWPSFASVDKYVILQDSLTSSTHERIQNLSNKNSNVEFWINLTMIDEYFDDFEMAKKFALILCNIWKVKLSNEFIGVEFMVESVSDFENEECGVTFFQKKFLTNHEVVGGTIPYPNVKEGRIHISPNGTSEEGCCLIREARSDEIPS